MSGEILKSPTEPEREGEVNRGFPKRFVGFSEPAEEILAVTPDRDHLDAWGPHGICKRIRDGAAHLHIVLAWNLYKKTERESE